MKHLVDCFFPYLSAEQAQAMLRTFGKHPLIHQIHLFCPQESTKPEWSGIKTLNVSDGIFSSDSIRKMAQEATAEYCLLYTKTTPVELESYSLERMVRVADDAHAVLLYSDYREIKNGELLPHPVNDYQEGSVRDDFQKV